MPPVNTIVMHTLLLPPERQDATVREQAQRLLARAWQPVPRPLQRKYGRTDSESSAIGIVLT